MFQFVLLQQLADQESLINDVYSKIISKQMLILVFQLGRIDPRIVPEAQTISELAYTEASELSYFGAKVLHPKTIWPAIEKNIPLRILNTFHPEHPGTRIVDELQTAGHPVKAITSIDRFQ